MRLYLKPITRHFFAILILIFSSNLSSAQTTLSAGDIMFIGLNSDPTGSPTADEIAILFLEPVTTGTEIYFTDFGYTGNSAPYFQQNPNNGCAAGQGAPSDGMIKWTATGAVAAGSQLVIRVAVASSGVPTSNIGSVSIVAQTNTTNQGMSLTSAGEVVHAFQGTINGSNQVTSATMLTSIHYNNGGWQVSLSTCQFTSVDSRDPGTGYEVEYGAEWDNGYYSGPMSGTKAALQDSILNISNWTRDNSTTYSFPISGSFSVTSTATWSGSWSPSAPTASTDVIIASNTSPNSFTCKSLTINSGYALVCAAGQTININGDVTNNGFGMIAVNNTSIVNFASSGELLGSTNSAFAGTIIVASGATLTTNDKLSLSSNATNTGCIGNSAGTISGNLTVQRYIPGGKRAFRFLGHPFTTSQALTSLTDDIDITGTGGSTNGFTTTSSNNPSAFWYDVSAATGSASADPGWTAFTSANTTSWDRYEMLRVLVRGAKTQGLTGGSYTPSATTLDMTGVVNQGTQVVSVTKGSNSIYAGVGNPFPSGVQMNAVTRGGGIATFYYVWDATSGAAGAYVAKLYSSNYILPSYGALITGIASSGTLTFEEADKASGGAALFKGTASQNLVQLIIEDSTTKWDELLINFDDNAMDVEEQLVDAMKFYNPGLDFFTLSKDDARLSIDVRPYSDSKSIQLGLTAYNRYNRYKIKTGDFDIPAGTKLFLHDKYLNKKEEMKAGFEYWFDVTTDTLSQGNQRFEINMVGKPTGIAETNANTAKMRLFPNPAQNEVKVAFDNLVGTAQVKLVSMTGQVVYSQMIETATGSVAVSLQNVPSGIYIVSLQSANARFTEKLIKE